MSAIRVYPSYYGDDEAASPLASKISIQRHPHRFPRAAPATVMAQLRSQDDAKPKPIQVWSARSLAEMKRTNAELTTTNPKDAHWTFFSHPERACDPDTGKYPLVFYAGRKEKPEGVLACYREIDIFANAEEGPQDGRIHVQYSLNIELVYVTPKARNGVVSTALVDSLWITAVTEIKKLHRLARRNSLVFKATIAAEVHSEGGWRICDEIYELIEDSLDGTEIEIESDFTD